MSPLLTAIAALVCYVLAVRGVALARDQGPTARRLQECRDEQASDHQPSVVQRAIDAAIDRLATSMMELLGPRRLDRAQRRLARAGYPDGMTVRTYAGRKALWALLGAAAGLVVAVSLNIVVGALVVLGGWFLIDIGIAQEGKRRQAEITRNLPDFLDIMAVTISAGSSFRNAMQRVAEALPSALSEEIMTTLRRMELGASRRDTFEELRERNDAETLDSFVTALLQAEELGAPLSDTLAGIARDMRVERGQRARKQASRAAPKVSLIVTVVMVPGVIILVFGAMLFGADLDLGMFSRASRVP